MNKEPILLEQARKVYDAMLDEADEDNVWTGKLVKFVGEAGVPQSRYSYVMRALQDMGCATQLRRGANASPSIWRLEQRPNEELYRSIEGKNFGPTGRVDSGGIGVTRQQLKDILTRLSRIEEAVGIE